MGSSKLTQQRISREKITATANLESEIAKLAPFKTSEEKLRFAETAVYNSYMNRNGLRNAEKSVRDLFEISATGVMNSVLREKRKQAETIQDDPKSFTKAPQVSDTAKDIKLPDPSTYPNSQACTDDLVKNFGVDSSVASDHCKQIIDPNLKVSKQRRQASAEIPAWAIVHCDAVDKPSDKSNFRSAGEVPGHYLPMGIDYTFERHEALREAKKSSIRSGSKEKSLPAWVVLHSGVLD